MSPSLARLTPNLANRSSPAVELADGHSADKQKVLDFLDGKLARFKAPRIVDFHEALPREDSGKIFKPRLRAPYWDGAGRSI